MFPLATIPPPPIQGFMLGPLDVRLYGILIAAGAFIAIQMASTRYERLGGEREQAEKLALWILLAGFVGGRIGFMIPRMSQFVADPLQALQIWEGGLALFGGLTLGVVAGVLLARRYGMDTWAFADAAAPAIPLAQAIGRWGNYFNQELYGRPTDLPWALEVEVEHQGAAEAAIEGFTRSPDVTFHPTFLYESLSNTVLVIVILLLDRTGKLRRGSLIWVYAAGYGIIRAMTEFIRVDTAARYLGLSRNNWIAILVAIGGLVGLWWWQRRPDSSPST